MRTSRGHENGKAFLFFSVDIVDSVPYKTQHVGHWPKDFQAFFRTFPRALGRRCDPVVLLTGVKRSLPPPTLWKAAGDEILYYVDIEDAFRSAVPKKGLRRPHWRWYPKAVRRPRARGVRAPMAQRANRRHGARCSCPFVASFPATSRCPLPRVGPAHRHSFLGTTVTEERHELALYYASAIAAAIKSFNASAYRRLTDDKRAFLLKGTAWFATAAKTGSHSEASGNIIVMLAEEGQATKARVDFIGPQIDIGFRIAKFATANRFVISVEFAILLLRDNYLTVEDAGLHVYSDGRNPIKGVLDQLGYPILFVDMADRFERAEQEVQGKTSTPAKGTSLMRYLQEYIKRTNSVIRYPRIKNDKRFG